MQLPSSPNSLISETGVIGPLIAEGPCPSFLALAGEASLAAGLACAVGTHLLVAWFTAGQDASLHGHLPEVLKFAVDVKVPDATVEAGAILPRGLAQSCGHIVLPGHAWGGTPSQKSGSLGFLSQGHPDPLSSSSGMGAVCATLLSENQTEQASCPAVLNQAAHQNHTGSLKKY